MDLREFVAALLKRWRMVVLCLLLGAAASGVALVRATPVYSAQSQLFVAAQDQRSNLSSAYQGGLFTQGRIKSYADLVKSETVLDPVRERLHLATSTAALAGQVSASAPDSTVLLNVSATSTDPATARTIANAIADVLTEVVPRLESADSNGGSTVKVTVVKRATVPISPISPRPLVDIALGVLVGLMVGVGGVLLRELVDTSFRSPSDVEKQLDLPTLGMLVYDREVRRTPLISDLSPHAPRSEGYRHLRSNLQFSQLGRDLRRLVVSSAVPSEGKSTSTVNLAISFAKSGRRVILVDGDLRLPRLSHLLGMAGGPGLSDVLIGRAPLTSALRQGSEPSLMVLPSGTLPPNPSELLGSQMMTQLLETLAPLCDIVVIDAPALLPVTDGAVLAHQADGVLMLIRHGRTRREQARAAVAGLRNVGAPILGAVLTMAPTRGPESHSYGYGYGYGYHDTNRRGLRRLLPRLGARSRRHAADLRLRREHAAVDGTRVADAGVARQKPVPPVPPTQQDRHGNQPVTAGR